jgi:hypothetical protein
MSSGRAAQGGNRRAEPSRAPRPSLSERRLNVPLGHRAACRLDLDAVRLVPLGNELLRPRRPAAFWSPTDGCRAEGGSVSAGAGPAQVMSAPVPTEKCFAPGEHWTWHWNGATPSSGDGARGYWRNLMP